jgi:GDPmannose 4,6-dehydratase
MIVKVYRESYNLHAIQGWLFNHEGTRRGEEFVTRKITKAVASIMKAIDNGEPVTPLELGNLDARRDWTDAEDCVQAVWRMLNQDAFNPSLYFDKVVASELNKRIKEYVVSSGTNHTVREFVMEAFNVIGLKGQWEGMKEEEQYILNYNYPDNVVVQINPAYYRPAEVDLLLGNSTKIHTELGWKAKTTFKQLVEKMVKRDIELVSK